MKTIFEQILERIRQFAKLLNDEPMSDVDLAVILDEKAKGTNLNWRMSVIDFLTLLEIDSSRVNRDKLAYELGVDNYVSGTSESNEALRKAVFVELAKNGGVIPSELTD